MTSEPEPTEPDYRYTLANERTVLAWLRTALALLASGVAVDQLPDPFPVGGASTALSLVLVLLSVVAAVGGALRWRAVDSAMRVDGPLPVLRTPWVLVAGLVGVAAAVAALVVAEPGG